MITLPLNEDQHRRLYRVLVSSDLKSWRPLPQARSDATQILGNGFEVLHHECLAFPQIAKARFLYHFGRIDGRTFGASGAGQDLNGQYVRIQCAEPPTTTQITNQTYSSPQWRTVFIGRVEYQEDKIAPGANYPMGVRVYHCLDLLNETKRWPLVRHAFSLDGSMTVCRGHPGYNASRTDGTLSGNKDGAATFSDETTPSFGHTNPGQGSIWSDLDAINHAIISSRPAGSAFFQVSELGTWLTGSHQWAINEGMTCYDFLAHILRRERGMGAAFLTWGAAYDGDDSASPTGPLQMRITVYPQVSGDQAYTLPDGSTVTLAGANSLGTTTTIDLVGDHRVVHDGCSFGDRYQATYDYIETQGDLIQAMVTLDVASNTLAKRWNQSPTVGDEALFLAEPDSFHCRKSQYDAVFQLYSAREISAPLALDISGSTTASYDYQCAPNAQLVVGFPDHASPATITWLRDTPDALAGDQKLGAIRGEPVALLRVPGAIVNRYLNVRMDIGAQFAIRPDGFFISCAGNTESGSRKIGNTTANIGSTYDVGNVVVTVTAQLPHRVRCWFGDPATATRRKIIQIPGLKLWLAHPGAIRSLDPTIGDRSAGFAPIRAWSSPVDPSGCYVIADDRIKLARAHALAVAWFSVSRSNATIALRCHGLGGSFAQDDGSTVAYPTCGKLVTTVSAAGQILPINTPITGITVDVRACTTTWVTDWADLDLR